MDQPIPSKGKRKDPEIAAAEWLLNDSESQETARPTAPLVVPTSGEGFDLAGPTPDSQEFQARAPIGQPVIPVRERARAALPPSPPVEQVWSRSAEWGTTLLWLGVWMVAAFWLLYLCINMEAYGLAAALFALACVGAVLLSYPMLITLERPVRITPEQAVRDYFAALSHHVPHYRRMWLLLSARGRRSNDYSTYDGFKKYWAERLTQLKDGHAGRFTPLVFQVDDFQSEKSVGRSEIDGRFQLRVFPRGHRDQGPIWSVPMQRSFARGPDGMWYLDDGTLAQRDGSAKPSRS